MGLTYSKVFDIRYYELNKYNEVKPQAIVGYLEEISTTHSESLGYGYNKLKETNNGWILTNWHVEMDRYPRNGEKIIVETWPSGFNKFYGTREYYIRTIDNEILGKGTALWVFFDTARRRPARIPDDVANAYKAYEGDRIIRTDFKDFKGIIPETYDISQTFGVRRRDIDTNKHVNNLIYIEWMFEVIPMEILDNYFPKKIEILYKKETFFGEEIKSSYSVDKSEDKLVTITNITDTDDSSIKACGRITWERR